MGSEEVLLRHQLGFLLSLESDHSWGLLEEESFSAMVSCIPPPNPLVEIPPPTMMIKGGGAFGR